jgi:hypothetical protein
MAKVMKPTKFIPTEQLGMVPPFLTKPYSGLASPYIAPKGGHRKRFHLAGQSIWTWKTSTSRSEFLPSALENGVSKSNRQDCPKRGNDEDPKEALAC